MGKLLSPFLKNPAAQRAKAVKQSNLDNRVGLGLGSLLGWPTPPPQGGTCSPPLLEQLLSLPSEPLLSARPAISSEGPFLLFAGEKGGDASFFLVSCSLKWTRGGKLGFALRRVRSFPEGWIRDTELLPVFCTRARISRREAEASDDPPRAQRARLGSSSWLGLSLA